MGDVEAGSRRRAVGARGRIMSCLRTMGGEVADPNGLASNALAEAVGYPGSSVAFAQLLSGMEKAGLIEREVRGRRTYRIRLADGATALPRGGPARGRPARDAPARDAPPGGGPARDAPPGARALPASSAGGTALSAPGNEGGRKPDARPGVVIDYDELARRLLVQVVQRLALGPAGGPAPAVSAGPAGIEPGPAPGQADLARTMADLERKLASIQSRQRKLSAENARLAEQLAAAQQSLADSRDAAARSGQLGAAELQMLERLLSSLHADRAQRENAEVG